MGSIMAEIFRVDREGWAFGVTVTGELFVGSCFGDMKYAKDTPENKEKMEAYWKTNSFAKELK